MPTYLHAIETVSPPHRLEQQRIRDVMLQTIGNLPESDRKTQRLIRLVYDQSGIETRHSILDDLDSRRDGTQPGFIFQNDGTSMCSPDSQARNERYAAGVNQLGERAVQACLSKAATQAEAVTHLITVSCTGFIAPGLDCHLMERFNLPRTVSRLHVGFMGCCAAFPALRTANDICQADPDALVLVVCVESCTLHLKPRCDTDSIISASVFSDGAAAALVGAKKPSSPALELSQFATALLPSTKSDMAWSIGNEGFEMVLSSYVPKLLGSQILQTLAALYSAEEIEAIQANGAWAVHPGGRAILDHVQRALALSPGALTASRNVLRDYGNMSSPTILFVLKQFLESPELAGDQTDICAMAFGPGLTLESGIFRKVLPA